MTVLLHVLEHTDDKDGRDPWKLLRSLRSHGLLSPKGFSALLGALQFHVFNAGLVVIPESSFGIARTFRLHC